MSGSVSALMRADMLSAWRDRRLPMLLALSLLMAFACGWGGIAAVHKAQTEYMRAQTVEHAAWLRQPPVNAHVAAHFGQMALRPVARLSAYEPGASAWVGRSVWLEAHVRDMPGARAGEDRTDALGLDLSPGLMVAVLAPIAVIALGFPLLSLERDTGLWRVIAASGTSPSRQLGARLVSLTAMSAIVLAPILIAAMAVAISPAGSLPPDWGSRGVVLMVLALLYLVLTIATVLAVAAWSARPHTALVVLSGLWALTALAGPRLIASVADRAHPVPSAEAFWRDIANDRASSGGEGNDANNPAVKRLTAQTLARYHVSSVNQLPIGLAGILLQAAEDDGNQVYQRHFDRLVQAQERQRHLARWMALLSPAAAFRNASAAAAGTDESADRPFVAAAEAHRRQLVAALNADVAAQGRGMGMGLETEAGPALWRGVGSFAYTLPRLTAAELSAILTGLVTLAVWLAVALFAAWTGAQRWGRA